MAWTWDQTGKGKKYLGSFCNCSEKRKIMALTIKIPWEKKGGLPGKRNLG